MSKYYNQKTTINGIVFDSRKEARRWTELTLLLKAGQIKDLQRQVKFVLIPAQDQDQIGTCRERMLIYCGLHVLRYR